MLRHHMVAPQHETTSDMQRFLLAQVFLKVVTPHILRATFIIMTSRKEPWLGLLSFTMTGLNRMCRVTNHIAQTGSPFVQSMHPSMYEAAYAVNAAEADQSEVSPQMREELRMSRMVVIGHLRWMFSNGADKATLQAACANHGLAKAYVRDTYREYADQGPQTDETSISVFRTACYFP